MKSETIHATTIAIDGRAVLIRGRSGSGKSDLALRAIDRGGVLVSDDYTVCTAKQGMLFASPPSNIAGLMEIRGVGIVGIQHLAEAPVVLAVCLDTAPERMPEGKFERIAGIEIPRIGLSALEPSAPIKLEYAMIRWGLKVA